MRNNEPRALARAVLVRRQPLLSAREPRGPKPAALSSCDHQRLQIGQCGMSTVPATSTSVTAPLPRLRPLPLQCRAMFAICSDLDETPDRQVYWEIARFLNSTQRTAMGDGLGLEVGNTIYFDMPPGQFAYWNTDDAGRQMARALIRSGHIDCLHSFGDLATTRDHARRALDELSGHGCRLECWVDHATAPTNFGADIMRGSGDLPGSPVYHADLTCDFGVRYVWRGRVTSVIGQDRPPSWRGIFTVRHPAASTRTIAKEFAKHALARLGNSKYAMHGPNEVLRPVALRDGRPVHEFIRCNPYWGRVDGADTAAGLADALTPRFLDRLMRRQGVCILYTHLGKIREAAKPFDEPTARALRHLAEVAHRGDILVTTTRRALGFCMAMRYTRFRSDNADGCCTIHIAAVGEATGLAPSDLDGLTFYVDDPGRTRVFIDDTEVLGLLHHPPDSTGRPSVSLPWPRLSFPDL